MAVCVVLFLNQFFRLFLFLTAVFLIGSMTYPSDFQAVWEATSLLAHALIYSFITLTLSPKVNFAPPPSR